MRDFFINALERLIAVIVVLMGLGTVVGAIAMIFAPEGGILAAVAVLLGGALYTILFGGSMYLFFGIYQNTRRTADACEKMAG